MDTTESTASPPPPSAPPAAGAWLWLDVAAKWVWRAALAFWALLVITALLLHFWIVPRLGDLKDDVAHWASQQSGLRIEIDSLDVVSHVFWASVEAKGISVSTIDGRRVLSLPKTTFDFSARSLLAQSVDRLVMDELSLELGRDEQGRWTVAGLPLQPSDDAKHPLAQWLLNQPQLQLRQARLSWREHASEPVEWLNQVDLEMSAGLFQHRFNLRATPALADMGQRFGAMGRFSEPLFTGRSGDPSTWQGEVYLEASELSAKPWFARWQLKAPIEFNAKAAVRAWFTVDAGEIRRAVVGAEYVDKSIANADSFNMPMQELVTEYCWGAVWGREELPRKTRSMLNLAMISVLNRPHELKLHIAGALRNGAPFKTMPEPLQELQRHLLRHSGGDRVMAQVLMGVSLHGLEPVLVAVELALQSGRVSAEHVLNVLSRLQEQRIPEPPVATMLTLNTPPLANLQRYDALRNVQPLEASPESDHA